MTNRRLIFYHQEGVFFGLIKNEKLDEIDLKMIRRASLVERGLIAKKVTLNLDEMKIDDDRSDIIELYNSIQSIRGRQ